MNLGSGSRLCEGSQSFWLDINHNPPGLRSLGCPEVAGRPSFNFPGCNGGWGVGTLLLSVGRAGLHGSAGHAGATRLHGGPVGAARGYAVGDEATCGVRGRVQHYLHHHRKAWAQGRQLGWGRRAYDSHPLTMTWRIHRSHT